MRPWQDIIGSGFTVPDFEAYCAALNWSTWRPNFIVVHNTATPSLKQRPNGFQPHHMDNLVHYYRDEKGWSAGPHLFVDDHLIWVFTPLTVRGVHSPSWNMASWGVEMLGDYDKEDFENGRGSEVQENAVAAVAILSLTLGLDPETIRFHGEDPKTTHRNCPGQNVQKDAFVDAVSTWIAQDENGEHSID
ncbi:MAG: N-acetylmuramoyl-L-alanine amidase [Magnetospiraceae bacterium]